MKLHTGDQVVVISGKDKGKTGTVLRVLPQINKVVVSDVNMRTKHLRAMPNRQGQIIRYEAALNVSNVMLIDPKTKKRSRIGFLINEGGKKVRISKRSGEAIIKTKGKVSAKTAEAKTEATQSTKKQSAATEAKKTKSKEMKSERVDAPEKSAFWKRMGFGSEALEEAEVKEGSRMSESKNVPDQGKTPDTFSHQRGS